MSKQIESFEKLVKLALEDELFNQFCEEQESIDGITLTKF